MVNIGPLSHLPSLLLSADIRVEYRRPALPWRGNVCSERPPSSRAPTPLSSTEADNYKVALPSLKTRQVHMQTVKDTMKKITNQTSALALCWSLKLVNWIPWSCLFQQCHIWHWSWRLAWHQARRQDLDSLYTLCSIPTVRLLYSRT